MKPILFIAPFKSLASIAKKVIEEKKLDIPVIVAANERAIDFVKNASKEYVIISRGGTAEDLKNIQGKVIIEVTSTFSDIFFSIEYLMEKGYKKIAIVTRDNVIDHIGRTFNILATEIHLCPCKSDSEIHTTIAKLGHEGIDAVIGCNEAVKAAKKINIMTTYLQSGRLSVERAIDEAVTLVKTKQQERMQLDSLNAVIGNIQEGIVILDHEHKPVFYNAIAEHVFDKTKYKDWYKEVAPYLAEPKEEQLVDISGNKLLLKFISLKTGGEYGTDVLVFQEVKRIEHFEQKIRLSAHQKGLYAKHYFTDIMCCSEKMKELIHKAEKFARTNANVLIYGETGTGKEGMAQSIHNASERAKEPFVSVNCASLPPSLIESELFGYVDGAFTGARKAGKRGLFELAHKGTVFLDEIGELPRNLQGRLLRVLQEREVMRVGDDRIIPLDLRVICATNMDLQKLIKQGEFREDLYYRINVLKLILPPLRERKEDILDLMQFYLNKYGEKLNKKIEITAKASKCLQNYYWPGNVRELKNIAEVLSLECNDVIDDKKVVSALSDNGIKEEENTDRETLQIRIKDSMKEMEGEIIKQMLTRYTPEEICVKLRMSRVTLWRKCQSVS
ncbi:MAG: sigma 54-interacting transcriptional regulator [Selenomonadaceae bacterium]